MRCFKKILNPNPFRRELLMGRKIVTWSGGGMQLQADYPNLLVQNDSLVTYVEDGKFSSSNGNLASYISALNLLEKMTNPEHREFIESYFISRPTSKLG